MAIWGSKGSMSSLSDEVTEALRLYKSLRSYLKPYGLLKALVQKGHFRDKCWFFYSQNRTVDGNNPPSPGAATGTYIKEKKNPIDF